MGYQVLARKWRPKNFSELVGQEHVVRALANALTQQRLHHAYLFTGTRGVGKTTLARILAKALNCETGITATPCGACGACTQIDAGRFVDMMEVDAATNTGVDEMRELLDQAQYVPVIGRFKVYIIDEVHMLSRPAFNSMLKTLEEPPEHVKFVLATTDPQRVPITVLSRCLQFNLKQMPADLIVKRLTEILEREAIAFQPPALALLARAAQGSMRDSLSLLDQAIAHGGGKVELAQVAAMLGSIDQEYLFDLLECWARGDGKAMIEQAQRMAERSLAFDEALLELEAILHRLALLQTVPEAADAQAAGHDRLVELAARFSPEDVQLFYQIVLSGRRDLPFAPDEYAGFTMTLMRMLAFEIDDATPQARAAPTPAKVSAARTPAQSLSAAAPATLNGKFDGNWLALVDKLKAGGMAHMLARHCELVDYAGGKFDLTVPQEHSHLLDKSYQDKLKSALAAYLGEAVRVNIAVGKANGSSLAAIQDKEQREQQARAIAAIEQDEFVRELVDSMDGKLIESSIRPV